MAHLPEAVDTIDETPLPGVPDPVVRAPKKLATLPEPPSYARHTLMTIAGVGLLVGASLGAVGIGIVYATHARSAWASSRALAARRAARMHTVTDGGGVFSLAPTSSDGGASAGATSDPPGTAVAAIPGTGTPDGLVASHARLGRGRTLPQVLRGLGVTNALASDAIRALRTLLNMRALQPADVVVVLRDPNADNAIRRVEYRRSETQVWAVTVAPDLSCAAQRIDVVRSNARLVTGFVVGESLEQALTQAHLHPDVVPRLQEIFQSLDLGHDLRRGDAVRLVVDEERLNNVFFRYDRVEAIDYRGAMGHRRAFFHALSAHGAGDFFDAQGFTRERGPLHAPLASPRMTSPFNLRRMHPILHRIMPHMGIDFGAPVGTPVFAAADGVVLSVVSGGPTGNLVRVAHPQFGVETGYAHLSRFAPGLRSGVRVHVHQLVGYVGSTGRSTGPHLHFSLKRDGVFCDPMTMYGGRRSVPAASRAEFEQDVARLGLELNNLHLAGDTGARDDGQPAPTPTQDPGIPAGDPPAETEGAPTE